MPADLAAVPLFPLPNVVLFPRAVLPLHIFEERYKAMTAAALTGERQIAMALLKEGWQKNYGGAPSIEPVVCVGKILAHEKLTNGTYNLLLQGETRATIAQELTVHPYRTAKLHRMIEPCLLEIDLVNQRRHLTSLFSNGRFTSQPLCSKFLEMLASPVSTSDIVDLISFNLVDEVTTRQRLLSEPDPQRRADRVVSILEAQQIISAPGSVNLN